MAGVALRLMLFASLGLIHGAGTASAQMTPSAEVDGNWSWLRGTNWYVPVASLPAILSGAGSDAPQTVLDQTVFHVDGYQGGYLWGTAVVQVVPVPGGRAIAPPLCLTFTGSVNPEGAVLLSFAFVVPGSVPAAVVRTQGIGVMRWKDGEWTMEMQMSTGGQQEMTHWAYMKQCSEGDTCNQSLPGLTVGLRQLLQSCSQTVLR
jgi:hypothetical protein